MHIPSRIVFAIEKGEEFGRGAGAVPVFGLDEENRTVSLYRIDRAAQQLSARMYGLLRRVSPDVAYMSRYTRRARLRAVEKGRRLRSDIQCAWRCGTSVFWRSGPSPLQPSRIAKSDAGFYIDGWLAKRG